MGKDECGVAGEKPETDDDDDDDRLSQLEFCDHLRLAGSASVEKEVDADDASGLLAGGKSKDDSGGRVMGKAVGEAMAEGRAVGGLAEAESTLVVRTRDASPPLRIKLTMPDENLKRREERERGRREREREREREGG